MNPGDFEGQLTKRLSVRFFTGFFQGIDRLVDDYKGQYEKGIARMMMREEDRVTTKMVYTKNKSRKGKNGSRYPPCVRVVEGHYFNIKVTTPEDLVMVRGLVE